MLVRKIAAGRQHRKEKKGKKRGKGSVTAQLCRNNCGVWIKFNVKRSCKKFSPHGKWHIFMMLTNKSSLLIMRTHVRFYISCSPFLSNAPALFPFLGLKISSNIRSGNLPFVFSIFLCPSFVTNHPVVHCFLLIMSAVSSEASPQSSVVLFFSFLLIYFIVPT